MNRNWLLASITGGAVLTVAAYAYFAAPPRSQGGPAQARADAPRPTSRLSLSTSETSVQLPIGQVVLFCSGVGYFQREGVIDGDARVDLSFPVQDINDLIKSMVLRDLDGGHVSAVSLRQQRARRENVAELRGEPVGQPDLRPDPQPGARRKGRGGLAAGQRRPARHDDREPSWASSRSRRPSARTWSMSSS